MKRIWTLVTVLCLILSCLCLVNVPARAADGVCGERITWDLTDGVLTISGEGIMEDYRYGQSPWFAQRSEIAAVVISEGIISLGDWAFVGCSNLTSVTIPEGVLTVGEGTFNDCISLTTVALPETVESIGELAFASCSNLSAINLPEGVSYICSWAFAECGLTSVVIPGGVTEISEGAFDCCADLTSVTLCDGVTKIGNVAFSNCFSLTEFEIPSSVTGIGEYAFAYCEALETVTFAGSAPVFGVDCFVGVTATVNYPANDATWTRDVMKNYGGTITWRDGSVDDADPITWDLTEGVLTISGEGIMEDYRYGQAPWFARRDEITAVVISEGIISLGDWAFVGCSNLTSVTIPEGVLTIGEGAFNNCSSLTTVTLPETVESIGELAFAVCSDLSSINLPEGISYICNWAFAECGLTSVVIPGGVTEIGEGAFDCCADLTSVTLCDGVTKIGNVAFSNCFSLTEFEVPSSVTGIGEYAFAYCEALETVTFTGAAPTFGEGCFEGVTATAAYPCDDISWTSDLLINHGGRILWRASHNWEDGYCDICQSNCGHRWADDGACVDCGAVCDHTFDCEVTYEATCTEDGVQTYTCIICGYYYAEPIPAPGHTLSNGSCTVCFTTFNKVMGVKAAEIGQTDIALTWDALEGAKKYWIYVDGSLYTATEGTAVTIAGRKPATAYSVYVLANFDNTTFLSAADADVIQVTTAEAEKVTGVAAADVSQTGFTVTWEPKEGVKKYWIYLDGSLYTATEGTAVTVTGRKPGTGYSVYVLANFDDTTFLSAADADVIQVTTAEAEKVTGVAATDVSQTGFTVTWEPKEGVKKYWIYLDGSLYTATEGTSITVTGRKPGTGYSVYVLANFDDTTFLSAADADVIQVTTAADLAEPTVTATADCVHIDWAAENCNKAWLYYGQSREELKVYDSSEDGTFTKNNLQPDTTYYFQIAYVLNGKLVFGEIFEVTTGHVTS